MRSRCVSLLFLLLFHAYYSNCFFFFKGDPADTDVRILAIPVVVEKLQSLSARVESVCCGSAHTLVLCSVPSKVKPCIYVMGLNSSGQLGLGKCGSVYRPTQIPLPEEVIPIGISTGIFLFVDLCF